MLRKLARCSYRNPLKALGLWVVSIVLLMTAAALVGSKSSGGVDLPSSESRSAYELLKRAAPSQVGASGQIVFHASGDTSLTRARASLESLIEEVAATPGVAVVSPFEKAGMGQVSPDGKTAFAQVSIFAGVRPGEKSTAALVIEDVVAKNPVAGVQVELGGEPFVGIEAPQSELLGIAAAIAILLFSFGSLLAVGLPVIAALLGVSSGAALLVLGSHVVSMPSFASTLAVMIGLGVGIDYALFILTRYAEEVQRGRPDEDAAIAAVGTAGRSVVFAALVVVASLLGMTLMGVPFVTGLAIGAAVAVITTLAATLSVTPALIALLGKRLQRTTLRTVVAALLVNVSIVAAALHVPVAGVAGAFALLVFLVLSKRITIFSRPALQKRGLAETNASFRSWGSRIQRRPVLATVSGLLVLLVLALPALSMRLGSSDNGSLPTSQTARRAYDLISAGFGPGANGPLLLVCDVPAGVTPDDLERVAEAARKTAGVVWVSPARYAPGSRVATWQVVPASGPQDAATSDLIRELRLDVLPSTGLPVLVGGSTAAFDDFADYLAGRLVLFMVAVLSVSFVLLVAVFRSLLVPLKAVLLNLLSIAAAYGVVVAVFQWGWGASLIGVGRAGPVEAFAPMMLFAIVFGLSMDYEVFLLSRIREEFDATGDSSAAVTEGLTHTARVITSAAAIMVSVFGSFVFEDTRQVKLFGVGLAVAVLLDATVVRMILVPATMELLGSRNWWLPAWLERLLPNVSLEGGSPKRRLPLDAEMQSGDVRVDVDETRQPD